MWIRIQADPDPRMAIFFILPEDDGIENSDEGKGDETTDSDQIHRDPHIIHNLHQKKQTRAILSWFLY